MNKKWIFKHDPKGYFELMKSEKMQAVLDEYGSKVYNALPLSVAKTYEKEIVTGVTRCNATIRATSYIAKKDNLKNNTLLKALGSAKG